MLASASGGLVEAVLDGVSGFSLPTGEAQAWRDKIVEVAQWDPASRQNFVAAATAHTRSTYCWSRVADDVLDVYNKALGAA